MKTNFYIQIVTIIPRALVLFLATSIGPLISSCSSVTYAPSTTTDMLYAKDRSATSVTLANPIGWEQAYQHFYKQSGIDTNSVTYNGINLIISEIGASSFPAISVVSLPAIEDRNKRSKKARQLEIKLWLEDVKAKFQWLFAQQEADAYTNINRSLCYQLDYLLQSSGETKKYFIISDLIMDSPLISFVSFQNDPMVIRERYDQLNELFDMDCSIGRLDNISSIELINFSKPEVDPFVYECSLYWMQFLQHHGSPKVRLASTF